MKRRSIKQVLMDKKFIKDGENYPQTKVLLVKGGTKEGIEIGLSDYCAEEYEKELRAEGYGNEGKVNIRFPKEKDVCIEPGKVRVYETGFNKALQLCKKACEEKGIIVEEER